MEADQVDEYVERWKTQPRVLVKITSDKVYTESTVPVLISTAFLAQLSFQRPVRC